MAAELIERERPGEGCMTQTVREALEANSPVRGCIDDHVHFGNNCHQCTASLAQFELNDRHAPKMEAALRETALEMRRRLGVAKAGDNLVESCVTAGIEAMGEKT